MSYLKNRFKFCGFSDKETEEFVVTDNKSSIYKGKISNVFWN